MPDVTASVGDTVKIAFVALDIDGLTPLVGLVDGSFTKLLLVDDSTTAVVPTITEIVGASGRYSAEWVPDAAGLWYLEVLTPADDILVATAQVGPPPDDVVDAIVAAVWSELLPGAYTAGQAGYALGHLFRSVVAANLTAVVPGSTTTVVHTDATQADDFYNGLQIVVINADGAVARRIVDYSATDGAFTLDRALPFDPDDGDQVIVLDRIAEVAISPTSDLGVKLTEIWQLLGLNPEEPLCVSKDGQMAGTIKLSHTEVGTKVIVQRVE